MCFRFVSTCYRALLRRIRPNRENTLVRYSNNKSEDSSCIEIEIIGINSSSEPPTKHRTCCICLVDRFCWLGWRCRRRRGSEAQQINEEEINLERILNERTVFEIKKKEIYASLQSMAFNSKKELEELEALLRDQEESNRLELKAYEENDSEVNASVSDDSSVISGIDALKAFDEYTSVSEDSSVIEHEIITSPSDLTYFITPYLLMVIKKLNKNAEKENIQLLMVIEKLNKMAENELKHMTYSDKAPVEARMINYEIAYKIEIQINKVLKESRQELRNRSLLRLLSMILHRYKDWIMRNRFAESMDLD